MLRRNPFNSFRFPKATLSNLFNLRMSSSASASASASAPTTNKETQPEFERLNQTVYLSKPDPKSKAKPNSKSETYSDVVPPRIVLLFGWMDAPFRIVQKYAIPYRERWPHAHILIKLSRGDHYFQGKAQQMKAIESLVDYLEAEGKREEARKLLYFESRKLELKSKEMILDKDVVSQFEKQKGNEKLDESTITLIEKSELEEDQAKLSKSILGEPKQPFGVIVHSFSDGGAGNQSHFLLKSNERQSSIFPRLRAQIFDCSVGTTRASTGSTAFSLPLLKRSKLLFYSFKSFLYVFLSLALFIKRLIGRPTRSDILRRTLNSISNYHSLLKSSNSKIPHNKLSQLKLPPRLYLYSKNDVLIDWKEVENHANDLAVEKGLTRPLLIEMERRPKEGAAREDEKKKDDDQFARGDLELRRWDTPSHCDIGRADFEGYWDAVDEFLSKALKD